MLRSGIKAFVRLSERSVSPRLRDVVANAMWMMGQCLEGEEIEQVVIDFSDAVKTLPVREEERDLCRSRGRIATPVWVATPSSLGEEAAR
jgi:hypothetical protein